MKTLEDARALAEAMRAIGRHAGREVTCLLTDMDQPLGAAVGNALEVQEALATRCAVTGQPISRELVLDACASFSRYSDLGIDEDEGRRRAEAGDAGRHRPTSRGSAGSRRRAAPPTSARCRSRRSSSRCRRRSPGTSSLGAIGVGNAAVHLGAGRRTKEDAIDHAVGVVVHASAATGGDGRVARRGACTDEEEATRRGCGGARGL